MSDETPDEPTSGPTTPDANSAEPTEPTEPVPPSPSSLATHPSAWNGPFPRNRAPRAPYPNAPAHARHGVRGAGIRAALNLTGQSSHEQVEGKPVAVPTGTSPFLPPSPPPGGAAHPPESTRPSTGEQGATEQRAHDAPSGKPAPPKHGPPGLFAVNPLGNAPKERPAIQAWTDS